MVSYTLGDNLLSHNLSERYKQLSYRAKRDDNRTSFILRRELLVGLSYTDDRLKSEWYISHSTYLTPLKTCDSDILFCNNLTGPQEVSWKNHRIIDIFHFIKI